jgi:prepilin-type N-terminal cleavage/methylation domain-containing protein/prepilin-type processing-associated H-X9-DG protein
LSANEVEILTMNRNHQAKSKSVSVRRHERDRAFTLTELLVVLATLGILAVVLLPALAGNQPGSTRAIQCINNMRQLGLASSLYANDNHDKLASNSDNASEPGANKSANWIDPAVGGLAPVLDWTSSSKNTNTLYLTINQILLGQQYTALIGNYVAKSVTIFVCPADKYLSSPQISFTAAGWSSRMRSCAMNGAMGDGGKYFGFNANGNPNGGHSQMPEFYNAKKVTDIHTPGPSSCWMIMDEHPDSDDDATFYVDPAAASGNGTVFTELPGSMHNNGAGLVYADGHSEVHIWQGRITTQPVKYITYLQNVSVIGDPASQNDLTWLARHTPAN